MRAQRFAGLALIAAALLAAIPLAQVRNSAHPRAPDAATRQDREPSPAPTVP